jgi:hypothetical protein
MANWQSFVIQVPGKDVLEPVRNVLETLLIYLEILKAILDTIKAALIDFGNPIKELIEALLRLIEELLQSLKATGVFAYFDVPDPLVDPNFDAYHGGFPAFTTRWKGSLLDSQDPNRPQPRAGTKSGFVILLVDASDPFTLLNRLKNLLRFFSKEFTAPRYAAPANFRAVPVGSDGDPILAVASMFDSEIEAIEVMWTLPTSQEVPDPGFQDVVSKVAHEFVPPTFLLERSNIAPSRDLDATLRGSDGNPTSGVVDQDIMRSEDDAGKVVFSNAQSFAFARDEVGYSIEPLKDENGDQVLKFQKYIKIDPTDVAAIFGQLGTFRYLDSDIERDVTYYYRVRAYSGDLDIDETANMVRFPGSLEAGGASGRGDYFLRWPSTSGGVVTMGEPTSIVSAIVPTVPEDFNVIETLRRLFQAAFSLDFHLPLEANATFDDNGLPTGSTESLQVGRGSLQDYAGIVATLFALGSIEESGEALGLTEATAVPRTEAEILEDIGEATANRSSISYPWQNFVLRRHSARLADTVASAMLEASHVGAAGNFQAIMEGSWPKTPIPDIDVTVDGVTRPAQNIRELVYAMTGTEDDPNQSAAYNALYPGIATEESIRVYFRSYDNTAPRINILAAVKFILSFTLGGVPPDWEAVVPLRDIIPWSGQYIYDLLELIRKLIAAYEGIIQEINNFIELLERKIDALERLIQFLIDILNIIESLQVGAYMLSASGLSGDVSTWLDVIDNAGGDIPPSGPGGYSAGVSFAYVAVDVAAFEEAFSIIF